MNTVTETGTWLVATPGIQYPPFEQATRLTRDRGERVLRYLVDLRSADKADLLSYALPEQQKAVSLAEHLIAEAKKTETDDVDDILQGVHSELNGFNPSDFLNLSQKTWPERFGLANVPGLRWVWQQLGLLPAYVELLKRYQATETRISEWMVKIEAERLDGINAVAQGEKMFEGTLEDLKVFEDALLAAEIYAHEFSIEIEALREEARTAQDISKTARLQALDGRYAAFQRMIDDMASIRNVIEQQVVTFMSGATADSEQVRTLQTLLTHGIPLFKTMTATVILALRRRARGKMIEVTRKGIATLTRRSTEVARQTIVEAQRQIEAGNFDIDAIEAAHNNVKAMLAEVEQVKAQSAQVRAEKRVKLDALYADLQNAVIDRDKLILENKS